MFLFSTFCILFLDLNIFRPHSVYLKSTFYRLVFYSTFTSLLKVYFLQTCIFFQQLPVYLKSTFYRLVYFFNIIPVYFKSTFYGLVYFFNIIPVYLKSTFYGLVFFSTFTSLLKVYFLRTCIFSTFTSLPIHFFQHCHFREPSWLFTFYSGNQPFQDT